MGTAGILGGWALQGYVAIEHCRDTWWLGTAGILGGWALQGYSAVGHCRGAQRLGTAGMLCGWALRGYVAIEHCSQAPRGGRGQHRLVKSNNPTARVGNKGFQPAPKQPHHITGSQDTSPV